jgi:hypothetical protein
MDSEHIQPSQVYRSKRKGNDAAYVRFGLVPNAPLLKPCPRHTVICELSLFGFVLFCMGFSESRIFFFERDPSSSYAIPPISPLLNGSTNQL